MSWPVATDARPYRAVVFDLWGTLIHAVASSPDAVADAIGASPDEMAAVWSGTRSTRETGRIRDAIVEILARLELASDGAGLERALAANARLQAEALARGEAAAVALLKRLRLAGLRTGVVSNCTSDMPPCFEQSQISKEVDGVAFSCLEGIMKPDVRIYERIVGRLGVAAAECLYVGDGGDDELAGAAAAGMEPVLLSALPTAWKGRQIRRLEELPSLIGV